MLRLPPERFSRSTTGAPPESGATQSTDRTLPAVHTLLRHTSKYKGYSVPHLSPFLEPKQKQWRTIVTCQAQDC